VVETRPDPIIRAVLIFRVNMSQDDNAPQRYTIEEEQTRQYRPFNARGTPCVSYLHPKESVMKRLAMQVLLTFDYFLFDLIIDCDTCILCSVFSFVICTRCSKDVRFVKRM